MAQIVIGVGSSHSPQLSTPDDIWGLHAMRDQASTELFGVDGAYHQYEDLLSVADPAFSAQITPQVWAERFQRSNQALDEVADLLQAARPDVVVIVGDDQYELFRDDGIPAMATFVGEQLLDLPPSAEEVARLPIGLAEAQWAAHADEVDAYPVEVELAAHLAAEVGRAGFDLTVLRKQPEGRSLGHAFTFVRRRLGLPRTVPTVPIFINTYYPPNVPSARRCHEFGRAIGAAVRGWGTSARVAVVASGGLSHFVVDEVMDRAVLDALARSDVQALDKATDGKLLSGNSEILNWIAAGGALDGLAMRTVDYVPAYRTAAGTGVGLAFAVWRPIGT